MANFRQRGAAKVRLAYAAVLDKPGQVFEPAIYGNLRVSPSENGFYGFQVRGIRIIGRLGFHQEVIALIKDRKLLILREVVGAKGFEPSTSWSRTRRASQAALRPDNCSFIPNLPLGIQE